MATIRANATEKRTAVVMFKKTVKPGYLGTIVCTASSKCFKRSAQHTHTQLTILTM